MATYNGEKYISQQLDSILNQDYSDWMLYIHDDGSNDNTLKIIKKYTEMYSDKIVLIGGEKQGSAKQNFFYLMKNIDADYVMFSDQDDYWLPSKMRITLNKCIELEENITNRPVAVFTDLKVVDQNLKVINPKMSNYQNLKMKHITYNKLMVQNVATGCTMMINRACLYKCIKVKMIQDIIMHDWWCALVASYFGKIGYIDQSLILYRQHSDNSVGAKNVHSINYLLTKIDSLNKQKKAILETQNQIRTFINTYGVTQKYIINYSRLSSNDKIKKIRFLIKNHIFKSGFIRNVGLFILC